MRAKERDAPDWKTLKMLQFLRRQNFYEFLKHRLFRNVTTDFENRTRRQADNKACLFLDVNDNTIPYRACSVHFETGNFFPFRTLRVWRQTIPITRYSWEKKKKKKKKKNLFPKMLSKVFIDDSKGLKSLKLSNWLFCLHSCSTV